MFLHVSVILFTGGGGISACLAAGLRGGGIPACLASLQGHTQEVEGSAFGGGFLPAHTGGGGEVEGSGLEGEVSRPTPRGVSRPTLGGGGTPACTEADSPPTATAAGGTHPTGMYSYLGLRFEE